MDNIVLGFQVMALGLGMVGLILGLLIACIKVMELIFRGRTEKVTESIEESEVVLVENESEIIAVITAAVNMLMTGEEEPTNLSFTVRNIKRK